MTNVTALIFAEAWRDHFRGEGPSLRVSFRRDPLAAQRGTEFRRQTDAISSRNCPRTGLDIDRTRSDGGDLDRVRSSPQARCGAAKRLSTILPRPSAAKVWVW